MRGTQIHRTGWVLIGSTEIDAMVSGVLNIFYFLQLPSKGNIIIPTLQTRKQVTDKEFTQTDCRTYFRCTRRRSNWYVDASPVLSPSGAGASAAPSLGWWRIPSNYPPISPGVKRGEGLQGELKRKITVELHFKIRSLVLVKIHIMHPSLPGPLGLND